MARRSNRVRRRSCHRWRFVSRHGHTRQSRQRERCLLDRRRRRGSPSDQVVGVTRKGLAAGCPHDCGPANRHASTLKELGGERVRFAHESPPRHAVQSTAAAAQALQTIVEAVRCHGHPRDHRPNTGSATAVPAAIAATGRASTHRRILCLQAGLADPKSDPNYCAHGFTDNPGQFAVQVTNRPTLPATNPASAGKLAP